MAIRIIDKKYIGTGLNYPKNANGVYFYFDNNLLVYHNKNIPFLSITCADGKKLYLTECNIIKNGEEDYTLEFYKDEFAIDCHVRQGNGTIRFEIDNFNDYPEVTVTLYKETNQKVMSFMGYENGGEGFVPEKKLSFYIEDKYFFENINIDKYDVQILDKIYITFYQKKAFFTIDTVTTPETMYQKWLTQNLKFSIFNEKQYYAYIRSPEYVEKYPNFYGYIVDGEEINLKKIEKFRHTYGKIIYTFSLEFSKYSRFLRYFEAGDVYKTEKGTYKIKHFSEYALQSIKRIIRRYFDFHVDGIYLTADYSPVEIALIKEAISSVLYEYPEKILLFDRLSQFNDAFGYYMINDPVKLFRHKDYIDYYQYCGEFLLGAVVRSKEEALKLPSACKVVVYCTPKEE